MEPIISIRGLSKTYPNGFQALKTIDLDIAPGEILALLGPNGAGKTTLISIICGIVSASEQEVTWRSVTTGDDDGVVLTLSAPDDAQLSFQTDVISHTVKLGELAEGPVVVDAGGIDMGVAFERMPKGSGREVSVTLQDPEKVPGPHAYWVRVTQVEGAKAWVSPFYVTIE